MKCSIQPFLQINVMEMRIKIKVVLILGLAIAMWGCGGSGQEKWEYKEVVVTGEGYGDYWPRMFNREASEAELNRLGGEGWELVGVHTLVETVHPNFGNAKYVTGLQPNTRSEAVVYTFKRKKRDVKKNGPKVSMDSETVEVADTEVVVETVEAVAPEAEQ